MSEPPLILNLALAAFAGYKSIKSLDEQSSTNSKSLLWISLFGVFTGLAGQSKNNGLAIFLSGLIILVLLTIVVRQSWLSKAKFFGVGVFSMSLMTFCFFVGPNPLFWKHPFATAIELIPYRLGLMQRQAQIDTNAVITGWDGWIRIVPSQIFKNLTPINFVGSDVIKFVLACLGLWVIVSQVWRSWKIKRLDAGSLAILAVGVVVSIPALFTPLNWDRYFVLPVFFVSMFIAVGVEFLIIKFKQIAMRRPLNER